MKQYVIIGASAAAVGAILKLLQIDSLAKVTCITREKETPYNKCFLADYVAGIKSEHALHIMRPDMLDRITLLQNTHATSIDRLKKVVECVIEGEKKELSYDALLLATGSSPYVPAFDPMPRKGFFTFHTLADAQAILDYAVEHAVKNVVIIGAGLSGLECADALQARGFQVTVVEKQSQVLPGILSYEAAECINRAMSARAINLLVNESVRKIITDNDRIIGVYLIDKRVEAQMIICATGLRPNIELAQKAGLALEGFGLQVNDLLQTSDEHIYAAGDVITVTDSITGRRMPSCLWPDAMQQGMIAAQNMCGKRVSYSGAAIITSTAFFGLKCAIAGSKQTDHWSVEKTEDTYRATLMQDGRLQGFVLIAESIPFGQYRRALLTGQPIQE